MRALSWMDAVVRVAPVPVLAPGFSRLRASMPPSGEGA